MPKRDRSGFSAVGNEITGLSARSYGNRPRFRISRKFTPCCYYSTWIDSRATYLWREDSGWWIEKSLARELAPGVTHHLTDENAAKKINSLLICDIQAI